jgi:cobalt-zinc-cadmium efflux system outer membrane protein
MPSQILDLRFYALLLLLAWGRKTLAVEFPEPVGQPPSLTQTEFLEKVAKANPRLDLVDSGVDLEASGVSAAGLRPNPSLVYDRSEIFGPTRSFAENVLRVELPLEISGRRGLRVDAAGQGVEAARHAAQRDKKDILLDALQVYLRAAASRLELQMLREESLALGRLVEAVHSRTRAGDASGDDLDRLSIESEALLDLIAQVERELLAYRRHLGLLTGDPSARFDASDPLELPAPESIATARLMLASHPEYAEAELRAQQAELELRAARRGWVPTLNLSAGAKSAVIDNDIRFGYVAGLALSLPLWDHGQAETELTRARLRMARARRQFVHQRISVDIEVARESHKLSVEQAQRYEQTQLPRLERLARRAEVSYQEGERPVFELLDAYRTARSVRKRSIELRLHARWTEIELWRALGLGPGGEP